MKKIKDNLWLIGSVAAQDELTKIRNKETRQIEFRKGIVKIGRICGYELMEIFEQEEITIETPLAEFAGLAVKGKDKVVMVNVLRAAFPFVEGLLKAFPLARQGIISAKRVEPAKTENLDFKIEVDYVKLPEINSDDVVIVADPMLATGSTILSIMQHITRLRQKPKKIILLSLVSTMVGIERVMAAHPAVVLVTVAIDPELNHKGYIVPGLGDAGDRAFGSA